jgi:hypothetical protein
VPQRAGSAWEARPPGTAISPRTRACRWFIQPSRALWFGVPFHVVLRVEVHCARPRAAGMDDGEVAVLKMARGPMRG